MSAFMCNPRHIATCADIIVKKVFEHRDEKPSREEIRIELATQNMESVSFRYSPEGREAYSSITEAITGALQGAGWESGAVIQMNLDDAHDQPEKFFPWRTDEFMFAEPLRLYQPEEAYRYLSCLGYQSCEHPGWLDSRARQWIEEAEGALAYEMSEKLLAGRAVWEIPEEATV